MFARRTLFLLVFTFIISNFLLAQSYFQKVYSFRYIQDLVADMEILPDGRTVIVGSTHVKDDWRNTRTLLMLLDVNGDIVWSKTFAVGKWGRGTSLALSPDGNLVVALDAADDATSQSHPGILKISTDTGEILWEKYFSIPDAIEFENIIQVADGGFVVMAQRRDAPVLAIEGMSIIFKIDTNGNVVWEKTLADSQHIMCCAVAENSNGEIYATGFHSKVTGVPLVLIKLTANGDLVWNKTCSDVYANHISIDADDNIWLSGDGPRADSTRQMWIQKMDADGNILWSKIYDTQLPFWIYSSDLHLLENGEALVCGHDALTVKSNTIIARISAAGSVMWAKKYASSMVNDYLTSIGATAEGEVVASGVTGTDFDDLDIWLLKADSRGDIPDCCQTDFDLIATDISSETDSLNIITSSALQVIPGVALAESVSPSIATVCPVPLSAFSSANAFTPNDDGINDSFRPRFECPPLALHFAVYNRWGKMVFETTDLESPGWDGKTDGEDAPSDVYVWRVEYEALRNGKREKMTDAGDVALLR